MRVCVRMFCEDSLVGARQLVFGDILRPWLVVQRRHNVTSAKHDVEDGAGVGGGLTVLLRERYYPSK